SDLQVKELEEQLQLLLVEQTSKKGQLTLLQSQQEAKTAQLTSINQEQEDLKSRLQQLASLEELQGQADTLEKALQETQTQKESNQQ
ncbi:hypothetical protein IR117_05680, partial [Streptococcus danieliae]|nr:hypothetical protein [Streptococcus danieliae]